MVEIGARVCDSAVPRCGGAAAELCQGHRTFNKDVIGSSVVNLYAENIFVGGSFTALVCGDNAVIPTTVEADSYAALTTVTTPDGPGFCHMPSPEPLPDTVICTADGDPHSPGATVRFHKPK